MVNEKNIILMVQLRKNKTMFMVNWKGGREHILRISKLNKEEFYKEW